MPPCSMPSFATIDSLSWRLWAARGAPGCIVPYPEADQGEIVARIKALREAHTVEAAPERTKRQAASVEEAVTTRIMRGRGTEPTKVEKPEQIEMPTADIVTFKKPVVNRPKPTHRQKVEGDKTRLSLF